MTDTSAEAVERLAAFHEGEGQYLEVAEGVGDEISITYGETARTTAATLRALVAERDAARRAARAFEAETAKAHENSKRWRSERDTWQRIAMDAAQRLMLAETERDAARGDVALLQDAWATLHNALNCIIHEEDNEPPDIANAIRIARAGLDEARALWPRVADDDGDAITAEDEDRAFLGFSDEGRR
jgi:hypothetical protein